MTPRACPNCRNQGFKVFMHSQKWGTNDMKQMEYRIVCLTCGHAEPLTTWSGHEEDR